MLDDSIATAFHRLTPAATGEAGLRSRVREDVDQLDETTRTALVLFLALDDSIAAAFHRLTPAATREAGLRSRVREDVDKLDETTRSALVLFLVLVLSSVKLPELR